MYWSEQNENNTHKCLISLVSFLNPEPSLADWSPLGGSSIFFSCSCSLLSSISKSLNFGISPRIVTSRNPDLQSGQVCFSKPQLQTGALLIFTWTVLKSGCCPFRVLSKKPLPQVAQVWFGCPHWHTAICLDFMGCVVEEFGSLFWSGCWGVSPEWQEWDGSVGIWLMNFVFGSLLVFSQLFGKITRLKDVNGTKV